LYLEFLHRMGSPDEIEFWAGMLEATGDMVGVARAIINAPEARAPEVVGWFQYYLGRNPLPGEAEEWVGLFQQRLSEEDVLSSLLQSAGYYARAGFNDSNFIQLAYQQIVGRPPSATEVLYWTGTLRSQVGRGGLVRLLLNSAEHRSGVVLQDYQTVLGR